MTVPEIALFAVVVGIVLAGLLLATRPLLARLAARNIRRRTTRVVIVILGLLVGTAVISSSLVVGDTLSYIFLEDVYVRLGAIDEIVSNEFGGQLFSFAETNLTQIRADLITAKSPVDGIAPTLLKVMPVRNVAGNKGNQQITIMGLNASYERAFGPLTTRDGRSLDTGALRPDDVFANARAAADLNATPGQNLTLFYGTTNQTLVHTTVADIVRDEGTASYERRAILFMDLRRAQSAFNENGSINLIRVSNVGGVVEGVAVSDQVTQDLRLSIASHHLALRVQDANRTGGPDRSRRDGALLGHGRLRNPRGHSPDREHLRHVGRGAQAGTGDRPRGRLPPPRPAYRLRPRGDVLRDRRGGARCARRIGPRIRDDLLLRPTGAAR